MGFFQGFALWGSGVVAGVGAMYCYYSGVSLARREERRKAKRDMQRAAQYNEAMRMELDVKNSQLQFMRERQVREASWRAGYEAGAREIWQGMPPDQAAGSRMRGYVNR